MVNLLEYALGGGIDSQDSQVLLGISLSGEWMTVAFDKAASDLTYVVEHSYALKAWHRDADAIFAPGEDVGEQMVEFYVPADKQFFVRVVVEE